MEISRPWSGFRFPNYASTNESNEERNEKCGLGFLPGCILIMGIMIGGGIFICPGKLLILSGSVGMSLLVWYFSGVICLCGALCYIELNSIFFSKAGGEHAYFMAVFGRLHSYFGPLPAFLFQWTSILLTRPTCLAINALSASGYIQQMKPGESSDRSLNVTTMAALFIAFITFLNCKSVKSGTNIQILLSCIKIFILSVIIGGGFYTMYNGNVGSLSDGFRGTTRNPSSLALAFYNGLIGYDGWSSLNYCTDMLENPSKTLPPAVVLSVAFTTIIFLLVNVSYFAALTTAVIKSSPVLVLTWAEAVIPSLSFVVPMGVVISILTAANGTLLVTARLCLASVKEKHLPSIFGMFHRRTGAPLPAILLVSGSSLCFCLLNDIHLLIEIFSFTVWVFYGMAFLALIVLRWKFPDSSHSFKNPIIIPCIAFLSSIFLVIVPVVESPIILLLFLAYSIVGIAYYTFFVFQGIKSSKMRKVTQILEYHLNVTNHSGAIDNTS